MAQTPQAEATAASGGAGGTGGGAGAGDQVPTGVFGNPMTILLLIVAGALFWWSMRRNRRLEERFREQRRHETVVAAEESARNVAHLMRAAPPAGAAAAAAREGLASAASMPAPTSGGSAGPAPEAAPGAEPGNGARGAIPDEAHARVVERAEAAAHAERAAAEEAERAARRAELAGESEARRLAAAEAAGEESRADTVDAMGAADVGAGDLREVEGVAGGALFEAAQDRGPGDDAERGSAARVDAAAAAAEHAQVVFNDAGVVAEARTNQTGALRTGIVPGAMEPSADEANEALRAGLRELDNEPAVPLGAVPGDGTTTCPPGFPVKGNAQSMIYHEPGQVSYPPTIAEFCFASAEAAEAAGYRQSRARGQRTQE